MSHPLKQEIICLIVLPIKTGNNVSLSYPLKQEILCLIVLPIKTGNNMSHCLTH